jgi:23S rRNA (pseudouridine1915-N3)-methyltransferase
VVKLHVAWIGRTKDAAIAALTAEYLKRIGRYIPTDHHELRDEAALLALAQKQRATLVLLDARGKQFTSEEFAAWLGQQQDRGTQRLLLAIGPADGFAAATRTAAALQISLGEMTLAHELARVVLLEQVYRAFTILKGHPYHSGH